MSGHWKVRACIGIIFSFNDRTSVLQKVNKDNEKHGSKKEKEEQINRGAGEKIERRKTEG
jgi:hypothetical protein